MDIEQDLAKTIKFLEDELASLHTGRASSSLVEDISVEAYGTETPLKGLANISTPDPKTINLQPWDKSALSSIEKAIRESNLNLSAVNTGELIRVTLPELTQERRQEFVKIAREKAEEARVSIRNHRHEMLEKIKRAKGEKEISEDEAEAKEKDLQKKIDEYNKKVDEILSRKEKGLLG